MFLTLKRNLALVSLLTTFFAFGIIIDRLIVIHYYYYFFFWKDVQAAYRVEELVTSSHKQMKDEEARWVAAMDDFKVAEKKI